MKKKEGFRVFLCATVFCFFSLSSFAEIVRFSKVNSWIYRGGMPTAKSDYDRLVKLGIRSIISLQELGQHVDRDKSRWNAALKKAGRTADHNPGYFIHHPMNSAVKPSKEIVLDILADMTDPSLLPAFIHCYQGRDRTGFVVALYRIHVENWDPKSAKAEMKGFGASKNRFFGEPILKIN